MVRDEYKDKRILLREFYKRHGKAAFNKYRCGSRNNNNNNYNHKYGSRRRGNSNNYNYKYRSNSPPQFINNTKCKPIINKFNNSRLFKHQHRYYNTK